MTQDPDSTAAQRPSPIPWPPILLVAVFGGGWLLGRVYPLPWPGLDDPPARAIGIGFLVGGIALAAWAALTFRRHHTTIMPHKGASTLVTDGPFRRFRNPIYVADIMIMAGIPEVTSNVWYVILAAPFAAAVTWLAILPEERHLEARFGDDYRNYVARSRRWI